MRVSQLWSRKTAVPTIIVALLVIGAPSLAAPPEIITNSALFVEEGGIGVLTDADLWIVDPDTPPSEIVIEVVATVLYGTLRLDGLPISPPVTFTQSDIDAGSVDYQHDGSQCPTEDYFVFSVSDGTTTLDDAMFRIQIVPVNGVPQMMYNASLLVDANCGARRVSGGELGAVDEDTPATELLYEIDSAPAEGELHLDGEPIGPGSVFTQVDVNLGRLSYYHSGGQNAVDTASLTLRDDGGNSISGITLDVTITGLATSISVPTNEGPAPVLHEAIPNPFNPNTTIRYSLPRSTDVDIQIVDLAGKRVRTLVHGPMGAGQHSVRWDGRDEEGVRVSSGVYIYRLVTGAFSESRRMVLLK